MKEVCIYIYMDNGRKILEVDGKCEMWYNMMMEMVERKEKNGCGDAWRVESEGSGMEENVVRMKSGVCYSAMMESVWYRVESM